MFSATPDTALEHHEFWRQRLVSPTFVYLVQGDLGTPIKVGTAKDPIARLQTLQTGNPSKLYLLSVVPGDAVMEASFHYQLKDARLIGEWFGGKVAQEFIVWMAEFADDAVHEFEETGKVPIAVKPPRRASQRSGLSAGAHKRYAKPWRTSDGVERPITVRFVEPAPTSPSDDIGRKLEAAAAAGFNAYELAAYERELREGRLRVAA